MKDETQKHPHPLTWWKHRRRHAYVALAWIILQTFMWIFIAITFPAAFQMLYSVIGASYTIPTGILISYYGASSYQDYLMEKMDKVNFK